MRESKVENELVKRVKAIGGICWKWQSPGRRGVPDRVSFLPIPEEHRAIVNRYVVIAETKAPGKEPSLQQAYVHEQLRALGFEVHVPDSYEAVTRLMGSLG